MFFDKLYVKKTGKSQFNFNFDFSESHITFEFSTCIAYLKYFFVKKNYFFFSNKIYLWIKNFKISLNFFLLKSKIFETIDLSMVKLLHLNF